MNKILFFISFVAVLSIINCGEKSELVTGQHPQVFEKKITKTVRTGYYLFLPEGYYKDKEEWPLMLFLHGGGERGDSLELIKIHGPPKIVDKKKDFPFILVSPQCPFFQSWSSEFMVSYLSSLLDEIVTNYRVDEDRVYITGLSMGGYGTWRLAIEYPFRFAAILPICGGGNPEKVCKIKHLPVWTFHNVEDDRVPIQRSEEMVNALEKCGGNVKFTVYEKPFIPGHLHDSWTETYNNPEVYEWLLKHSRVKGDI